MRIKPVVANKDAKWYVRICSGNNWWWVAETDDYIGLADSELLESTYNSSKLKAKNSWKRYAKANKIKKWEWYEC